MADFFDAVGDGITGAGDEVAGDEGDVGALLVGQIDGAANVFAAHVAAEVDVADLRDGQAVEGGRQIADRDFDAADLIVDALGGETVDGAEKWRGAGKRAWRCGRSSGAKDRRGARRLRLRAEARGRWLLRSDRGASAAGAEMLRRVALRTCGPSARGDRRRGRFLPRDKRTARWKTRDPEKMVSMAVAREGDRGGPCAKPCGKRQQDQDEPDGVKQARGDAQPNRPTSARWCARSLCTRSAARETIVRGS